MSANGISTTYHTNMNLTVLEDRWNLIKITCVKLYIPRDRRRLRAISCTTSVQTDTVVIESIYCVQCSYFQAIGKLYPGTAAN